MSELNFLSGCPVTGNHISLRWSIEPMFNQLKQAWGMKEAWQQTRQTLHRWVHITMAGYGLVQLLSCLNSQAVAALCQRSP